MKHITFDDFEFVCTQMYAAAVFLGKPLSEVSQSAEGIAWLLEWAHLEHTLTFEEAVCDCVEQLGFKWEENKCVMSYHDANTSVHAAAKKAYVAGADITTFLEYMERER